MKENKRVIADLVGKIKATRKDAWQYLEVKQLAEILARHREKLRLAIREYRQLKAAIAAETDPVEKTYLGYEGMFLRDHLRDSVRLYMMINHDYHEAFDAYMEETRKPAAIYVPLPAEFMPEKPAANRNGPKAA